VAEWLNSSVSGTKTVGADFRASFDFQDMREVARELSGSGGVEWLSYFIDTRKQSDRKPYLPNDIVIEVRGRKESLAVAHHASLYASQQGLTVEETAAAYFELVERVVKRSPLLEAEVSEIHGVVESVLGSIGAGAQGPNTVFDVQRRMNEELLARQFGGSPNIKIINKDPDRVDPRTGRTSHGMPHGREDLVVYPLAKAATPGHLEEEIRRGVAEGLLGERRQVFAIAENGVSLLRAPSDSREMAHLKGIAR